MKNKHKTGVTKMKKSLLSVISLLLVMTLFLAACGGNDSKSGEEKESAEKTTEPQQGGKVTYALGSEFQGLLEWAFYEEATDSEILQFFNESLIQTDDNLNYIPGIASWVTEDNQHYTFTFKEGVKWHNGEELTVNDWVFALETIAHPEYTGPRYVNVKDIVGAPEFHDGKAESISGIKVIDDYNIEITFDKARVNNLENLWTYAMPEKHFEGVAVKDMASSPQVRQNPVGLGPFKVKNIVQGESVEMERFDDYYQGKPNLDTVVVKVIDAALTSGVMQSGEVDVMSVHASNYEQVAALDNVNLEKVLGLSYSYIGFKFGHWDAEKEENVMDNEKFQNLQLRQALVHALNREEWIKGFFNGLGEVVDTPVPSAHWIAADKEELTHYEYDPEKAKTLLDEAGYKDVDGDGFREDPNGEQFSIQFAHYAGSNPTFEPRAKYIVQAWNEVGIKTEFAKGALIDGTLYYDMLEKDDKDMEVHFGTWGTGTDPDPSGLWGRDAIWNFTRWTDDKNDQLLEDALDVSIVGSDQEKRKELYVEWQQLWNEQLPIIPIVEYYDLWGMNKRVQGVNVSAAGLSDFHKWYVTDGK